MAATIAVGGISVAPVAVTDAGASVARASGCTHAVIGGHRVCLAVGQRCARAYQGQYLRYAFTCTKQRGKYVLEREQQQQQQ